MGPITNVWFAVAGAASAVTLVIHVILGGKYIARPLLKSADMSQTAKFTNYFCWHLVTIFIGVMAFSFLAAAMRGEYALGLTMTFAAMLSALLNAGIVLVNKQSFKLMPQWLLFLVIAILGGLGVNSANHLSF